MTPEPAAQVAGGAGPAGGTPARNGSKGESALVVERLTKRFGDRVAFEGVSFEVGYGEVFGFLGPNGAGAASAVFEGSHLLVQLLFTPLTAGWSIWVGIAISARSTDVRAAQQLGVLASLPPSASSR